MEVRYVWIFWCQFFRAAWLIREARQAFPRGVAGRLKSSFEFYILDDRLVSDSGK